MLLELNRISVEKKTDLLMILIKRPNKSPSGWFYYSHLTFVIFSFINLKKKSSNFNFHSYFDDSFLDLVGYNLHLELKFKN